MGVGYTEEMGCEEGKTEKESVLVSGEVSGWLAGEVWEDVISMGATFQHLTPFGLCGHRQLVINIVSIPREDGEGI